MATTEALFNELPAVTGVTEVVADNGSVTGRATIATLKTAFTLGSAADQPSSAFATAAHNHTGVYQPVAAALTALSGASGGTSSTYWRGDNTWATIPAGSVTLPNMTAAVTAGTQAEKDAFNAAFGVTDPAITTSRTIAPSTDDNRSSVVSNGVVLTLDSGSLTDGAAREFVAASGATFTVLVGTASLTMRQGGAAIAGGQSISSARSQTGVIAIRRVGSEYRLEQPTLTGIGTTITASAAFPVRTAEQTQYVVVSSASAVALTMSAGQFPAGDTRQVIIYKYGSGTLTLPGLTTQGDTTAITGKCRVILSSDPLTADTPWVSVQVATI